MGCHQLGQDSKGISMRSISGFLAAVILIVAVPAGAEVITEKSICHKGDDKLCYDLAARAVKAGDIPEALTLYELACGREYAPGCFDAGVLRGKAGEVKKSKEFFFSSCKGGIAETSTLRIDP